MLKMINPFAKESFPETGRGILGRKRLLPALILFFAFCSVVLSENLLQNGDFEDGLQHWSTPEWFREALPAEVDNTVHHALGNSSLKFSGSGARRGYTLQQIKIQPGKNRYQLSGWMKTKGFENSWSARIQAESIEILADRKEQYRIWPLITPVALQTMDWQYFECMFSPPESALYLRVILLTQFPNKPTSNSGTVWFDDVKLIKLKNTQQMAEP